MKRLLLTISLCAMVIGAMAADLPKQGFGFQIGYAQPTLRLNSPEVMYPKDSLVNTVQLHGLKVGVVYDGSFALGFGTSIGINYTFATKTTGWQPASSFSRYPETRSSLMYHQVEAFVDWQYKFEIAKETYLMLYTGPTIQCGIGLTEKHETRIDLSNMEMSTKEDRYTSDDPNSVLRRINVTWGVGAGFQYKRYFLRGGYDFGLINPYKNPQFTNVITGASMDRNTRGRLDQWEIKVGMYLWYR